MDDQPHILVTGDAWQYVPFGRARLKALRATGLSYSSQTFQIDQTVIKVRIAGTQSFIEINGESTIYCESGQLSWPFRPLGSPLWGEAATWHFMDIGLGEKYLGKIKLGKDDIGKQANDPKLTEGMRSKAIGWPLATGDGADEKNAKTQDEYSKNTIAKKKIMMGWPASIFSGKMRLFMQSLYGAKEPKPETGYFPFIYKEEPVPTLEFQGVKKVGKGGGLLLVRPNSMGIFTAPDDTYWLLDINEGPGNVIVTRLDTSNTSALVKQLPDMSPEERTKAEAYIFANCRIDIRKPEEVVYATGKFSVAPGSPMYYGWKWNTNGSKASIVHHEELGEVIPEIRWHARTTHLTFTYTAKTDTAAAFISVSGEVIDHNDWIDGWGGPFCNLWVPEPSKPTALTLYSLRATSPPRPPMIAFPKTPIYGYYMEDKWVPLLLEYRGDGESVVNSSASGIIYPNGGSCPPHSLTPWEGGVVDGLDGYSFDIEELQYYTGMLVSFNGVVIDGRTSDRVYNSYIYGATSDGGHISLNWPIFWVHTSQDPYPLSATPRALQGIENSLYIRGATPYTLTNTHTSSATSKVTIFNIVIPRGDAEAVYLPRYARETGNESVIDGPIGHTATSCVEMTVVVGPPDNRHGVYTPVGDYFITNASGCSSYTPVPWEGSHSGAPVVTPVRKIKTDVLCFNKVLNNGELGVPGGSYAALWDVTYYYPYYDRGMYTYTSYGGRYIMSEHPAKPSNPKITWHNFVGWA